MRQSFLNLLFTLFIFCFTSLAFSQSETVFSSNEILRLRIEGSWTELLKQRYLSPEIAKMARISVNVVIINRDKTETVVSAQAGLRGNTSLSPIECIFPKFSLYFSQDNVSGTILSGIDKLKVGSHCSYRGGNSPIYGRSYDGKSPHREALVYRLLQILEIPSFRTRPLLVQYVDAPYAEGPVSVGWNQAFFLEGTKQFSERLGYEMIEEDKADLVDLGEDPMTDIQRLVRVALFNELIENNDWKVNIHELQVARMTWNTYLAKNLVNQQIEVIPNDFDLAAAVTMQDGKVTAPADVLRRLPVNEINRAKDFYRGKRAALYEEIKSIKQLDPAGWQYLKKKLDLFFEIKIKP